MTAMATSTGHLTAAQLAELRSTLEAKRTALLNGLARHGRPRPAEDDRPVEEMDLAERDIEESELATLAEREHRLLDEVNRALARLDAGTYGVSEVTGEPIPFARLKALPWARANHDET